METLAKTVKKLDCGKCFYTTHVDSCLIKEVHPDAGQETELLEINKPLKNPHSTSGGLLRQSTEHC